MTTFLYSIYFFADMKVLITGSPGVGKTTLIKSLCEDLNKCSGFYTEELRQGGKRTGFDIVTLDGSTRAPLARVNTSVKGPKVGQYTVIISDFELLAQKSLNSKSIESSQYVIIDEIGKMENFSSKFQGMVRKIFESDSKHIIATIPMKNEGIGLVKEIVNRSDTEIIEVTKDNRDFIKDIILQKII